MTDSEKLDFIITKVVSIEKKVDSLEKRMDSLEKRMDSLEKKVDSLEKRMDAIEKRMDSVERRLSIAEVALEDDRRENRLTRSIIENDLNHSIRLIAEGHYDLNRKVDEAIHTTADVAAKEEIYDLKFIVHKEKLKELSERMEIYAAH